MESSPATPERPIAGWTVQRPVDLPAEFVAAVEPYVRRSPNPAFDYPVGYWAAQLLWQRGVRSPAAVQAFLDLAHYSPASPFAFGDEMRWAIARLQQAHEARETVAIWGDFDADGVTATAVLWEGLGQFFRQNETLHYTIPNRFTESHGLSRTGIDRLAEQGCTLIVTCDTGSTNWREIEQANALGIDVIVTDHHTLLPTRPPVVALINPRSLPADHPLATLSGVAVAYKLVEALYETLPDVPAQPLASLLDLVAIGLIADLVELRGDCRYLARRGIQQLQKNRGEAAPRPGIAKLLDLCQKNGDRPTDISFGIGPRINAISRIHGDAQFAVELLTSRDRAQCNTLAQQTELANIRRKALQRDVLSQVEARLKRIDLSTTYVIVLADAQWSPGVLGLVAGQIAQTYARPTLLFNVEGDIARGSARSVNQIDLYRLVQGQEHLLRSFGGHPYAAGMSVSVDNLPLLTDALNRQLRQEQPWLTTLDSAAMEADLTVTVADLGQDLFRELNVLEPFGMGNSQPRLLIRNAWFQKTWHQNLRDTNNRKVSYIRTTFELCDETASGFPGVWWGHYKEELPTGRCDAIAELDYNPYNERYEIRLLGVRLADPVSTIAADSTEATDWILDWRETNISPNDLEPASPDTLPPLAMRHCPSHWAEFYPWFRQAQQDGRPLAIAYPPPSNTPPIEVWRTLVGLAKYLSRTGKQVRRAQMLEKLGVGDRTLQLGFLGLEAIGFSLHTQPLNPQHPNQIGLQIRQPNPNAFPDKAAQDTIQHFLDAVREEQFRRRYFAHAPLKTIRAMARFMQDGTMPATLQAEPQSPPPSKLEDDV